MLFRFATLEQQLAKRVGTLFLVCLEERGRTLIAARDVSQGSIIHAELPMLSTPPAPGASGAYSNQANRMCATCLSPLTSGPHDTGNIYSTSQDWNFCSKVCHNVASNEWLDVAQTCDLSELLQVCSEGGLKFPLLTVRLACMTIQMSCRHNKYTHEIGGDEDASQVERGNPLTELNRLCYANIDSIPEEWSLLYRLLNKGLSRCGMMEHSSNPITLPWFAQVMARLHPNTFRVDTVSIPARDVTDRSSFLLRAVASTVSESIVGPISHSPGSAVYLLGSMFNHSCEPNVEVTFPSNNSKAVFKAARDIQRNEELTISYVDQTMNVSARRRALKFGYGFNCQCPKCISEGEGSCI